MVEPIKEDSDSEKDDVYNEELVANSNDKKQSENQADNQPEKQMFDLTESSNDATFLNNDMFQSIKNKYLKDSIQYSQVSNDSLLSSAKKEVNLLSEDSRLLMHNREVKVGLLQSSLGVSAHRQEGGTIRDIVNKYTTGQSSMSFKPQAVSQLPQSWLDEIEQAEATKTVDNRQNAGAEAFSAEDDSFLEILKIRNKYLGPFEGEKKQPEPEQSYVFLSSKRAGSPPKPYNTAKFEESGGSKTSSKLH